MKCAAEFRITQMCLISSGSIAKLFASLLAVVCLEISNIHDNVNNVSAIITYLSLNISSISPFHR